MATTRSTCLSRPIDEENGAVNVIAIRLLSLFQSCMRNWEFMLNSLLLLGEGVRIVVDKSIKVASVIFGWKLGGV